MRRVYDFLKSKMKEFYDRGRGYDDYFNIPFSLLNPLPKTAEKVMDVCCRQLEMNGIVYYVSEGTALGFYREGGFIKHDDDIDVAIPVERELDENLLIKLFVNDLGMQIGRKLTYWGKLQQLACYDADNVLFDMCFYWKDKRDDYVWRAPECKRPYRLNIKYFGEPFIFDFHGRAYPLFCHTEEWLRYRYGDNWRIPETSKGDWREASCFK